MTRTVTVRNRVATGDGGVIVLDNNNYTIVFDLDSEWDSYSTKTMRVQNGTTYTDVVFTGTSATLPQQSGLNVVQIGLYAGNLQTSTPAVFVTLPSIRTAGGSPVSPSSSVYDQIIALLNGFSASVSKSGDTATITIVDPQGTTTATVSDGAKGEKGDTGAQGPQGETGETGATGATGATGNGIASAVLNADYTLTLTFTDGTSYTTPSIRGATGEAPIDDTTAATDKVYSSSKTAELLADKQPITDNSLTTTAKTVPGAINEVNGNKLEGVQLNGNDLTVTDKKVNIPIALTSGNKWGIIRGNGYWGLIIDTDGALTGVTKSYATYSDYANPLFISKGTLENVLTAYHAKRLTKTAMDSVAVANSDYYLGEQTTVAITLPASPTVGDMISVVFYSGSTATSLTVSGSTIGTVPTPSANQRVDLNMVWDGTYWALLSSVMAVS